MIFFLVYNLLQKNFNVKNKCKNDTNYFYIIVKTYSIYIFWCVLSFEVLFLKCTHKSGQKTRNASTSSLRSAVTFIGKTNSFKKIRRSRKWKTAEQSEDVENNCVFSSFFGTFFLLWLANKEEKKYKYKTHKMKNIINTNTSKYIFRS